MYHATGIPIPGTLFYIVGSKYERYFSDVNVTGNLRHR